MPGKFDWIQLVILLLVFGGGIIRFIVQNVFSGKDTPQKGDGVPRPRSPAVDFLDKLRENEEAIATRQAAPPSAPRPPARDPEDAYFGDDGLEGVSALQETEVEASHMEREGAPVPPATVKKPPPKKRRSGDRIPGTIRDPREEVIHPHSLDLQKGVSLPRSLETRVRQQDVGIEEDLAVHTSTQPMARATRGHLRLPAALGLGKITLRQAVIGQIILGPPRALENRGSFRPRPSSGAR